MSLVIKKLKFIDKLNEELIEGNWKNKETFQFYKFNKNKKNILMAF